MSWGTHGGQPGTASGDAIIGEPGASSWGPLGTALIIFFARNTLHVCSGAPALNGLGSLLSRWQGASNTS